MDNIGRLMLTPPAVFIILLGSALILSSALKNLSFKRKDALGDSRSSYACGEDSPTAMAQPDYSQFFPFAFFFTLLHVVALIITTVPVETMESFAIAVLYILGAAAGLRILFRR